MKLRLYFLYLIHSVKVFVSIMQGEVGIPGPPGPAGQRGPEVSL